MGLPGLRIGVLVLFGVATLASTAIPSFAVLGESVDSLPANSKKVSAFTSERKTTRQESADYKIHEYSLSKETTIREYSNSSGIVFGVAWSGIDHPTLEPLLGKYSGYYRNAMKENPLQGGQRNQHSLRTEQVVVEKWALPGRFPRTLQGRAYNPSLLPQGVDPHEIH
jgi:hypothetical protein